MKYTIILFILISLIGCKEESKTEEVSIPHNPTLSAEYIAKSTYWCLNQHFGADDIPKYCANGTYTNKHIPLAYWANDTLYHVFTDIIDNNFHIYAAKGNTEIVDVYTIENWNDPHTNAIIYVDDDGYVFVQIASRGASTKFQSGKILKSKYPHELDFECIDGCDNVNFEAYPQVWLTKWGTHTGYTHYVNDLEIHERLASRQLWARTGDTRTKLVNGGHYSISYYDGEYLYLAYNLLVDAHPDNRVNLYLMKTNNGVDWVNVDNKPLILPLSTDSEESLIYKSDGYIYLKDITEGLKISFIESSDYDPTKGERVVKEWFNGEIKSISETNHNYNSASYFGNNMITTQDGSEGRSGGNMVLYGDKELYRDNSCNWNYVRKAVNNDNVGVASCGSDVGFGSHYIVTIN